MEEFDRPFGAVKFPSARSKSLAPVKSRSAFNSHVETLRVSHILRALGNLHRFAVQIPFA